MHPDAEAFIVYIIIFVLSSLVSLLTASRCKCTYLSEAGLLLLAGAVGGGFVWLLAKEDKADQFGEVEIERELVRFSSETLFFLLLPPIIFKSGYDMQGKVFWANIGKIVSLAFLGTMVSSFIVGLGFYGIRALVGMGKLSMPEALAFGALISATDPVTTLAIFEQLHVDQDLFNVVFGESVLNDAVSIVLYHTFIKYYTKFTGPVTLVDVARSAGEVAWIFGGSLVLGIVLARLAAALLKFARRRARGLLHGKQLELALFVLTCYTPFLVAESLELSGIVAILFAGVVTRRYVKDSLSEETRDRAESMVGVLAYAAESLIFIELGTCAWRPFHASPWLVLSIVLLCLFARAAHVYPIGALMNACHCRSPQQHFKKEHMHMVWFSGLRGAIAYALSTQFPGQYGDKIASLTMAVVLSTIWILGGATEPLLKCLGIAMGVGTRHDELKDEESNAVEMSPSSPGSSHRLKPVPVCRSPQRLGRARGAGGKHAELKDEESNAAEMSPASPGSHHPKPVAVGRSLHRLGRAMGVGRRHAEFEDEESDAVEMTPSSPRSAQLNPVAVGRPLEDHEVEDDDEINDSDVPGAQGSELSDSAAHGEEGI